MENNWKKGLCCKIGHTKDKLLTTRFFIHELLPPANEVWRKVMFLHLFVCPQRGGEVLWCHFLLWTAPRPLTAPPPLPPDSTFTLLAKNFDIRSETRISKFFAPGQQARGTHVNGMLSCFNLCFLLCICRAWRRRTCGSGWKSPRNSCPPCPKHGNRNSRRLSAFTR